MNTEKLYKIPQTGLKLPYLEYLPYKKAEGKYPLCIFLHGSGERGTDPSLVAKHGFPRYCDEGTEYPFILISPQCPDGKYWACFTESLNLFLDHLIETLPVDINRICLTGLSLGGTGTWMWAMANPERFAAIIPVCASGIVWNGASVADIPIWAFHGDADTAISYEECIRMTDNVKANGGNPRVTIYPGVGHDCWNICYQDKELIEWILKQSKA